MQHEIKGLEWGGGGRFKSRSRKRKSEDRPGPRRGEHWHQGETINPDPCGHGGWGPDCRGEEPRFWCASRLKADHPCGGQGCHWKPGGDSDKRHEAQHVLSAYYAPRPVVSGQCLTAVFSCLLLATTLWSDSGYPQLTGWSHFLGVSKGKRKRLRAGRQEIQWI